MQSEKKKKAMLAAGIFLGAAGVATATAGGIIYSLGSESEPAVDYIDITFDGNEGILDGTKLRAKKGAKFNEITLPRVVQAPESTELVGWTNDAGDVTPETILDESQTIKAKWQATDMRELSFVKNGDTDIEFEGVTILSVEDGTEFGLINKPTATKKAQGDLVYRFAGWKYVSNNQPVLDTDKITGSISVYPWFNESQDVDFINITFKEIPQPERVGIETTFNGVADEFATTIDETLKWGQINKPVPKKTETTVIGTETIVTEYDFDCWCVKNGNNYEPITNNDKTFSEGDVIYARFNEAPQSLDSSYYVKDADGNVGMIANGSESEGPIQIISKDPSSGEIITHEPIAREDFNQQVYLGKKVTSISPNFLRGCTTFNKPIVIPNTVTYIGSGFLYGCEAFNQSISMPSTIGGIGKCFLYGCIKMNSSITLSSGLYSIDDYFMFGCKVFNRSLAIPSTVINIGSSFMSYCSSFNNNSTQTFTIPTGLVYLGPDFMSYCESFRRDLSFVGCSNLTAFPSGFLFNSNGYNGKVTLPTTIQTIGSNFCSWTNGNPDLSGNFGSNASYKLEQLTTIGDGFLNKTTYNRNLILSNSPNLQRINGNLLRTNTDFNSQIELPNSVTWMGEACLYGCTSFTNPSGSFKIPTNITHIGDEFMAYCVDFTSKLIIPSSCVYVGNAFLYRCFGITSIEINCSVDALQKNVNDDRSFCQYFDYVYENGIYITGSVATQHWDQFIAKFAVKAPDYTKDPMEPGRYLYNEI